MVVALIGEKAGRSPIVAHLGEMKSWRISWRWSAQFPADTSPFDLGIIYTPTADLEAQIAATKLPLIIITNDELNSSRKSNIEKIPRNQLNTFALATIIRLLLKTTEKQTKVDVTEPGQTEDIVISLSRKGTILSWNPAAAVFFGYQSDDVLGEDYISLFVSPGDRPAFRHQLQITLQNIAVTSYQHTVITNDAVPYTLGGQLRPQTDNKTNQITKIIAISQPASSCLLAATQPKNQKTQTLTQAPDTDKAYPTARDHQEQIHFTQTLAQFSRILSNPDSTSTLSAALGLFGKTLGVQRVTILRWHYYDQQEAYPPTVLEQWSADQSPPCHEKLMNIPLKYWDSLLNSSQITSIHNRDDFPDLAEQLSKLNIVSLLALPIKNTVGELWGYLIFSGDRPATKPYSGFVLQTLQMAAELIH